VRYKDFHLECMDMFDKLKEDHSSQHAIINYIEWRLNLERELHGNTNTCNNKEPEGTSKSEPEQLGLGID
jgi:hypothetical protein